MYKRFNIRSTIFYKIYIQYKLYIFKCAKKKQLLEEAKIQFDKEKPKNGNYKDFKNALQKHLVTYSEYMYQYEFWRLNEEQRNEFISRNELIFLLSKRKYMAVYNGKSLEASYILSDKIKFLQVFHKYIYRRWFYVKCVSFDFFSTFVRDYSKCIAKPLKGNCGKGVFLIRHNEDLYSTYKYCCDNDILVEELIEGNSELQEFHKSSLNTIRVVTVVDNHAKASVFGSFFRMGVGNSVIDNAHAGGIFAQINVHTGIVETCGFDTYGHSFFYHPDSKKMIKGFIIPNWDEIKRTCIEACSLLNDVGIVIGWDVIINKYGKVEFVEANFCPDFDLMQSPLKIGVRKRLITSIN